MNNTPLIKGGQAHTDKETEDAAYACMFCGIGATVLLAVVGIANHWPTITAVLTSRS